MVAPSSLLLDALLRIHPETLLSEARNIPGWGRIRVESGDHLRLGIACMTGNLKVVRETLAQSPDLINACCLPSPVFENAKLEKFIHACAFDGMPPLHAAISAQQWAVGEFLLSCPGVDLNAFRGRLWDGQHEAKDWSPLAQVLFQCHDIHRPEDLEEPLRFARLLLNHGAKPFIANPEGNSAFSLVLHAAARPYVIEKRFRIAVAMVELFLPELPSFCEDQVAQGSPAHEAMERVLWPLSDIDNFKNPPGAQDLAWFRKKTGLPFASYGELMLGWLMDHGLDVPVVREFASQHTPDVVVEVERRKLEGTLSRKSIPAKARRHL
jgi:hypothetical protein